MSAFVPSATMLSSSEVEAKAGAGDFVDEMPPLPDAPGIGSEVDFLLDEELKDSLEHIKEVKRKSVSSDSVAMDATQSIDKAKSRGIGRAPRQSVDGKSVDFVVADANGSSYESQSEVNSEDLSFTRQRVMPVFYPQTAAPLPNSYFPVAAQYSGCEVQSTAKGPTTDISIASSTLSVLMMFASAILGAVMCLAVTRGVSTAPMQESITSLTADFQSVTFERDLLNKSLNDMRDIYLGESLKCDLEDNDANTHLMTIRIRELEKNITELNQSLQIVSAQRDLLNQSLTDTRAMLSILADSTKRDSIEDKSGDGATAQCQQKDDLKKPATEGKNECDTFKKASVCIKFVNELLATDRISQEDEFIVVPLPRKTWHEANAICKEQYGTHLFTIPDANANQRIREQLIALSTDNPWIGLNDIEMEGNWKWIDGSDSDYANWERGQPNGGRNENCVIMYDVKTPQQWYDVNCDRRDFPSFVCALKRGLLLEWQLSEGKWEIIRGDAKNALQLKGSIAGGKYFTVSGLELAATVWAETGPLQLPYGVSVLRRRSIAVTVRIHDLDKPQTVVSIDGNYSADKYTHNAFDAILYNNATNQFEIGHGFYSNKEPFHSGRVQTQAGVWYNLVLTIDDTVAVLYVDGVATGHCLVSSLDVYKTGQFKLLFGLRHHGCHSEGCKLNGTIRRVRLYNEALSAAEVRQLNAAN